MGTVVGRVARLAIAAALGMALGFLVAVSVFADGNRGERLPTVGALALAYALVGAALGFRASWWYGAVLVLPGLAVLVFFAAGDEGRWWHLSYAVLIAALSIGGAHGGGRRWPGRRPSGAIPTFAGRGQSLD